jgi:hypothetical protein
MEEQDREGDELDAEGPAVLPESEAMSIISAGADPDAVPEDAPPEAADSASSQD